MRKTKSNIKATNIFQLVKVISLTVFKMKNRIKITVNQKKIIKRKSNLFHLINKIPNNQDK